MSRTALPRRRTPPVLALAALLALAFPRTARAQEYAVAWGDVPAGGFTMCAGDTRTFTLRVTNRGTATWTTDTYHLSYHWFQGATMVVRDGARTILAAPVPPGGTVLLASTVTAPDPGPSPTGPFTIRFDMVREGIAWFSNVGASTADVPNVTLLDVPRCAVARVRPAFPALTAPHVDRCNALTRPGSVVWCVGRGFGAAPGQVLLKGLQPTTAVPDLARPGPNRQWADGAFLVDVPEDLIGFRRGTARVQVVSANGLSSNEVPITIEPTLDVGNGAWALRATSCSHGHKYDVCADGGGTHQVETLVVSPVSDTDTWTGTLANDWVFLPGNCTVTPRANNLNAQDIGFDAPTFAAGNARLSIAVHWSWGWNWNTAAALYDINCAAQGPRGVPWQ